MFKYSNQDFGKSPPHFHISLRGATLKLAKRTMHIKKNIKTGPTFRKEGYSSFNLIYFANCFSTKNCVFPHKTQRIDSGWIPPERSLIDGYFGNIKCSYAFYI